MAYDEQLADRVREALAHISNVHEKKMFGGLAFLVNEKMCVNLGAEGIMCRIDPAIHDEVLKRKGCQTVIMRGREYKGYVRIDRDGIKSKKDFAYWISLSLDYNKVAKSSKK